MIDTQPLVSFIVPCYNLGHLLRECVDSIIGQTFANFEILIMDDCSPDNTRAIGTSFTDGRVRYIRNDANLGHLRNYNKGITLANGKYIWLISADDSLRSPDVLRRFVEVLEANPNVSFAFCQAMRVTDGIDTGLYSSRSEPSGVISGKALLRYLADWNFVCAPSAIARKDCYEKAGMFPLDLPYAGDWYLWCRFALMGDVLYIPEPLVNYRQHALSMTTLFKAKAVAMIQDELAVRWRLKRLAESLGATDLTALSDRYLAEDYARRLRLQGEEAEMYGMNQESVENSIKEFSSSQREAAHLMSAIMVNLGDTAVDEARMSEARRFYCQALTHNNLNLRALAKLLLTFFGWPGILLWQRRTMFSRSGAQAG